MVEGPGALLDAESRRGRDRFAAQLNIVNAFFDRNVGDRSVLADAGRSTTQKALRG